MECAGNGQQPAGDAYEEAELVSLEQESGLEVPSISVEEVVVRRVGTNAM